MQVGLSAWPLKFTLPSPSATKLSRSKLALAGGAGKNNLYIIPKFKDRREWLPTKHAVPCEGSDLAFRGSSPEAY